MSGRSRQADPVAADPRAVRRALAVLEALPRQALAILAERLIDRLDASEVDPDLEPDHEDLGALEDEPCFPAKPVAPPGNSRRVTIYRVRDGERTAVEVNWTMIP